MSASPRGGPVVSKVSLSSLTRRFGWGHLIDHEQACPDCGGTGRDGDEDDSDPCSRCDASGRVRWGSFYAADTGECYSCKADVDLPIAAMYTADEGTGELYVCLRCYVRHHRAQCGCALWSEVDVHVPDARPPRPRYRRTATALGWRLRRVGPDADAARAEVIAALEAGGGVHARAAAIVGMCRDRFARLLARHDLADLARRIRTGEPAP